MAIYWFNCIALGDKHTQFKIAIIITIVQTVKVTNNNNWLYDFSPVSQCRVVAFFSVVQPPVEVDNNNVYYLWFLLCIAMLKTGLKKWNVHEVIFVAYVHLIVSK